MPVVVVFAVQIASRVMVGEGDLDLVARTAPDVLPADYIQGRLLFLAPGQPVAHIDDDLEFAVIQCLHAIPALAAGATVQVTFSDAPGAVEFSVHDGTARITGDYFPTFEAPAAALLQALLGSCERFIAFVRSTLAGHPRVQERISQLDPWVAEASEALGGLS